MAYFRGVVSSQFSQGRVQEFVREESKFTNSHNIPAINGKHFTRLTSIIFNYVYLLLNDDATSNSDIFTTDDANAC